MPSSIRIPLQVSDSIRPLRGLLDTSVVIDLGVIEPERLPVDVAISAITMAELSAGPQATDDLPERARRQAQLQRAESTFDPLAFDTEAARAYGQVFAAVAAIGRKPRGARAADMLIAATAVANGLPLFTRNPKDFDGLSDLVEIFGI